MGAVKNSRIIRIIEGDSSNIVFEGSFEDLYLKMALEEDDLDEAATTMNWTYKIYLPGEE